jgi:Flp pilus assembly pilin Flp
MLKICSKEDGQSLLEYVLIVAVLILVLIAAVPNLRSSILGVFTRTQSSLIQDSDPHDPSEPPVPSPYLWSDELNNLDHWSPVRGTWEASNGVLRNTSSGEGRIFTPYSGDDFMVDIDIAHLIQGNGYGVWLRANEVDGNNINGYTFQYDPGYGGGEFIMRKWVNGSERAPFARVSAEGYDWYDPHKVQVIANGDTFTVMIDGQQVLTAQDSTYTSGQVGLRTWSTTRTEFHGFSIEVVPLEPES